MNPTKETRMTRPLTPALPLLDELDELRAKALAIRQGYPSLPQILQNETEVEADWSDGGRSVLAECYGEDIAALIVAAVNRLPELTAALRAVLAVHTNTEIDVCSTCFDQDENPEPWPCPTVTAITTALEAS